jgi:hypothetical protein
MPQFQPDTVTFKDGAGYGAWDIGHGREHIQFVQVLAQQVPAILIPDFDLLALLTAGQSRKSMVESHNDAHVLINQALGITSIDFTQVNLDDENDFSNWLGYHSSTHAQIRQILGLI